MKFEPREEVSLEEFLEAVKVCDDVSELNDELYQKERNQKALNEVRFYEKTNLVITKSRRGKSTRIMLTDEGKEELEKRSN